MKQINPFYIQIILDVIGNKVSNAIDGSAQRQASRHTNESSTLHRAPFSYSDTRLSTVPGELPKLTRWTG
jgi:hypothetical protein